jgi:DNA-binding transcriptional LysR family regulator
MQGELRQVADMALFAKIVQTGGISRCAEDLGMERTTVSRRLGALESSLGVKLLDRSPKHIAVTDAGRRCLQQCEMLLESSRNAHSLATSGEIVASATPLVVGAPPDIIDRYLDRFLSDFQELHPGVEVDRQPVSHWSEDAIESVDLGLALAPLSVNIGWTNSVARLRQSIYASTAYVFSHSEITTPFELQSHDCIVEKADGDRHAWRFERNEKITTVAIKPKFVVSGLLEAREATLAGLGISRLPEYLCEPYLSSGRLVDLMPNAESAGRDLLVISPRNRQRKSGTATLRTYLDEAFHDKIR